MPPEQQDKNQNPAVARPVAIRTMRSDAEELFKTTKPSLLQMMGNPQPAASHGQSQSKKPKVLLVVGGVLFLAAIGGGVYFLAQKIAPRAGTSPASPRVVPRAAAPALFATETSRTITVKKQDRAEFLRLMADTWQEAEREGTVKRLIIMLRDGPQEYPATLGDFFEMWRVTPPASLTERLNQNLMVFLYQGKTGNRLGLAVQTREPERTFADMLSWEPALLASVSQIFFDERSEAIVAPFEDRTYRNIDWRYLKLSQERDLGIGYAIFPVGNIFVFTVGREGMETVINRLFAQ